MLDNLRTCRGSNLPDSDKLRQKSYKNDDKLENSVRNKIKVIEDQVKPVLHGNSEGKKEVKKKRKFLLAPMGVLAPGSPHA